ncbi:hypothetical protein M8818_007274 [Zalaria obscura]|uniref:Uncharacterized protein n=1 Tax=Zalaria obscura TaxID=2024903 RepID=A0ACC3S6B3_9PEZI
MGSSSSKAARNAAGAATRQYPSRTGPAPTSTTTNAPPRPAPSQPAKPGPTVRPQARASYERDEAINLDASDPDFARSLRELGPVQPNPTLSPSSAFPQNPSSASASSSSRPTRQTAPDPRTNPAITVLAARSRLADAEERESIEAGRRGHAGREFLDVGILRQVLTLRENGTAAGEIERRLGLRKGVVERLGGRGVVEVTKG